MKKIAIVLAMLLVLGAGPAFAAFTDNNETLLLSVYNVNSVSGDTEYGFNTGINLNSFDWSQSFTTTVHTGLTLAPFAATTNWSDLQVGIYGIDLNAGSNTYGRFYAASTDANNALNGTQYGAFRNAANSIRAAYAAADTNSDNVALLPNNLTSNNSYDILMNGTVTPGNYNSFNALNAPSGEANLGVFGDSDPNNNVITMYLYGYQRTGVQASTGTYLTNGLLPNTPYMAKITLAANGDMTISNVPVPGAIWLLGSGLLGLLGLRRKNA